MAEELPPGLPFHTLGVWRREGERLLHQARTDPIFKHRALILIAKEFAVSERGAEEIWELYLVHLSLVLDNRKAGIGMVAGLVTIFQAYEQGVQSPGEEQ